MAPGDSSVAMGDVSGTTISGISDRLLTARLRVLEERGLICRTVKPTNPPEVTYAPTARLDDMRAVVKRLNALAVKWQSEADKGCYRAPNIVN